MAAVSARPLVLVAHGTADRDGRRTLDDLTARVRTVLWENDPGVRVRLGYLERAEPLLEDLVAPGEAAVVVPLFLARGYHVRSDLPERLSRLAPDAARTAAVGEGGAVAAALRRRVAALSEGHPGVGVVLVSAGSGDPRARSEVASLGARLEAGLGAPVRAAYLSGPGPDVTEAVRDLRRHGRSHLVGAVHLLAPGRFWDTARRALAEHGVTEQTVPLATDARIAEAVVESYRAAVSARSAAG